MVKGVPIMIRYSLTCDKDHSFDSWFKSASAFDALQKAGMLSCAVCGSAEVRKSVMTPRIGKSVDVAPQQLPAPQPDRPLSGPASPAEQAVKELRDHIEANSEDVGKDFATEARKIHHGEAPARSIRGEAKLPEAKALIEEGVPVAPLPFLPQRKTN